MKRKLDANNEPAPEVGQSPTTKTTATAIETTDEKANSKAKQVKENGKETTFNDLGLDPRLLQATSRQKFQVPSAVQQKAIPLILDGHDVLAKAPTGSGKTAAYVLPVLQSILKRKRTSPASCHTACLILVPTRELANQVSKNIDTFSAFCGKQIRTVKVSDKSSDAVQRSLLAESPDIVVATPSRAWQNIKSSALCLDKLSHLILDEADLVLSYGYEEDLQSIAAAVPKGTQSVLMSATLTSDVDSLVDGILCRKPTRLVIEDNEKGGAGVSQYIVKCAEDEKFLLTFLIYKLQLVKGKSIIFVADDVDRSYRLRLFLEQFGVRSCVLNPQMPVSSRIHVVEEFNRGVYNVIIASDETEILGGEDEPEKEEEGEAKKKQPAKKPKEEPDRGPPKKKRKSSRKDTEYSVSRGLDFRNVALVVNFDFPSSARSYEHRVGRTARAGQNGMALSFVITSDKFRSHPPTSIDSAEHDEKILRKVIRQQQKKDNEVKDYAFDMKQVESFRYRFNDALRAVTKVAVREARVQELRQELLKSEKLKRHFEENPSDLQHLRHDGELRAARTQAHLKHVPEYLLPKDGKEALSSRDIGFVPLRKYSDRHKKGGGKVKGKGHRGKKLGGGRANRKVDPLKSFRGKSRK